MKISFTWSKVILTIIIVIILANLLVLNIRVFTLQNSTALNTDQIDNDYPSQDSASSAGDVSQPQSTGANKDIDLTDLSQVIQEATASLTKKVDELSSRPNVTNIVNKTAPVSNIVQEIIIPLGSGNSTSSVWVDLNGIETYVSPANYGSIKEMYFEAGLKIPTKNGRVFARLRNVTDNVGLIESEISHEGDGALISSGRIPVPATTKLYRVQVKSTLGAQALVDNARIKIYVQ